jgi:hypothetical protein
MRGEPPLADFATKYDVDYTQFSHWNFELLKGAQAAYVSGSPPPDKAADLYRLHATIWQLVL